jgi:hypothetical protein
MNKTFNLLFYVKKSKINSVGESPIYLRNYHRQQNAEISTKRMVKPTKWNSAMQKVSGSLEECRSLNYYLKTFEQKVYDTCHGLMRDNDRKINNLIKKKDSIEYVKNQIRIKYEIAKAFIDAENAQFKSFLLQENINKVKNLLNEVSEKYKHGRAIKTDVTQMELSVIKLKGYSKINAIDYNNMLNQLQRVSGIAIHDSIVLKGVEETD